MLLFTIGFTQKTAEQFFNLLRAARVQKVVDVRLNNRSQLAGFSKAEDLPYFLRTIGGVAYEHRVDMAPTQDMLDRYKKQKGPWSVYEAEFDALLRERRLIENVVPVELDNSCLLCSEHEPRFCHRRLVAEYLRQSWGNVEISHLL